jgi:SAM-dependent methyltransferase
MMFNLCPEMMGRKIPEANIQQAVVLDYIIKLHFFQDADDLSMLCVGSFEDTTTESLKQLDYPVTNIDPAVNMDLATFRMSTDEKFDIIFSVSVIEHVVNDEQFIEDICSLLNDSGMAILTCDFKNDYKPGDPLPATDVRFYTKEDLIVRLPKVLKRNNCSLTDEPSLDDPPDFLYQGHTYSFATFVFRKDSKDED